MAKMSILGKVLCPVCNTVLIRYNALVSFSEGYGKFCPCCSLPTLINEKNINEETKGCIWCKALNPIEANYCRYCGKEIKTTGKECGHDYIDLGLSVFWSTETLPGFYLWMNSNLRFNNLRQWPIYDRRFDRDFKRDGKDVATARWGGKWRTPTKEEFEELMTLCKWEKFIIEKKKQYAIKITGPNGNHIIMKTTGYAGCLYMAGIDYNRERHEIPYSQCIFWTSSGNPEDDSGYGFQCTGYDYKPFSRMYDIAFNSDEHIKKRDSMWLEEPIILDIFSMHESFGYSIRPVMDKE